MVLQQLIALTKWKTTYQVLDMVGLQKTRMLDMEGVPDLVREGGAGKVT